MSEDVLDLARSIVALLKREGRRPDANDGRLAEALLEAEKRTEALMREMYSRYGEDHFCPENRARAEAAEAKLAEAERALERIKDWPTDFSGVPWRRVAREALAKLRGTNA